MGSWNQTCGVTQLPILSGQKVVQFLITYTGEESKGGQFCHNTEFWAPRSIQMYGDYNDYGGIENVKDDWHLKFVLENFQKDLVEIEQGKNKSHDIPVKKDKFDFDLLMEAISENRLFVEQNVFRDDKSAAGYTYNIESVNVGNMMVLGTVFEALVDRGMDSYRGKHNVKSIMERIIKAWREMKSEVQAVDPSDKEFGRHMFKTERIKNEFCGYSEGRKLNMGIESYYNYLFDDDMLLNAEEKDIYPLAFELAKFKIFEFNFDSLRRQWAPQTGGGSQDQDFDLYSYLNRVVDAHIYDIKKEYESQETEFEEDFLDEDEVVEEAAEEV